MSAVLHDSNVDISIYGQQLRPSEVYGVCVPIGTDTTSFAAQGGDYSAGVFDPIAPLCMARWEADFANKATLIQRYEALQQCMSLEENVRQPLRVFRNMSAKHASNIARNKLNLVNLPGNLAGLPPRMLSDAQSLLGVIARSLTLEPRLLVMKDPTALDHEDHADRFKDLLVKLTQELEISIVIESNNLLSLRKITQNVLLMSDQGTLSPDTSEELRDVNSAISLSKFGPKFDYQDFL